MLIDQKGPRVPDGAGVAAFVKAELQVYESGSNGKQAPGPLPISNRSVARWKHFEKHLRPLRDALTGHG